MVQQRSNFTWKHAFRCVTLLCLLSIAAIATLAARSYAQRGVTFDPGPQPIPNVPLNRFGVNAKLEQDVTEEQLRRDFSAIRAAGFGWVRQEFQWEQIESDGPGQFWDSKFSHSSWDKWDRLVNLSQEYDVQLIARIDRPPRWSHPGVLPLLDQHPDWEAPPDHPDDFARIVAAIAGRYRGKLRYFQLWNEPNLRNEWAGKPVNPAGYAELLRAGATSARTANPDAVILAAALAPNVEGGPAVGQANMSDLLFLRGLYAAGAAPYFDVVAVNPYGLDHGPYADRSLGIHSYQFPRAIFKAPDRFDFSRPIAAREIMVRNGDAGKPIWASEFGWNDVPVGWTGQPSPWMSVTPQQQAGFTAQAYQRARQEWPWMGVMNLWYFREPVDVNPRDPTPYFAILRQDWTPTPAYDAVRALGGEAPRAYTGVDPVTNPAASYGFAGAWRAERSSDGARTYAVAGAPEAFLAFAFDGPTLSLITRTGPNEGRVFVRIDESANLANALPTDSEGNAYLDLYSPTVRDGVRVDVTRSLPEGPHRLDMVIKGARNPASSGTDVAISAYVVGAQPWAGWSYLLGVIAAAFAITLAWPVVTLAAPVVARVRPRARYPDLPIAVGIISAAAVYYLAPVTALALIGLLAFAVLAVWRLDLAVFVAIPAAPLEFLPKHLGPYQVSPFETVVVVCTVAWIIRGYWRGSLEVRWRWGSWAAIALLGIGLVSLFVAQWLRFSLREFRLVIVEPALWLLMVGSLLTVQQAWRLVDAVVLTGAGVSVLGLIGLATGHSVIMTEGVRRIASVYPSPDNLGLLLSRVTPLALCVVVLGTGMRRTWYLLALVPLVVALLLTFSRGAWFGVLAATFALGLVWNWRLAGVGLAIAIVVGITASLLNVARLNPFGTTFLARLWVWQAAFAMIRDHTLFGIGLDQFLYTYPRYRLPEAWREPYLSHPHNEVLDFWLQLGLLGLGWIIWVVVTTVRTLLAVMRKADARRRVLALVVLMSMVGALAHGMLDNMFFLPDLALLFWMVVAITETLSERRSSEGDTVDAALPGHDVVTALPLPAQGS